MTILFVSLTASNGRDDKIWVNMDKIVIIHPDDATNGSSLFKAGEGVQAIRVKESPSEILTIIGKYLNGN